MRLRHEGVRSRLTWRGGLCVSRPLADVAAAASLQRAREPALAFGGSEQTGNPGRWEGSQGRETVACPSQS